MTHGMFVYATCNSPRGKTNGIPQFSGTANTLTAYCSTNVTEKLAIGTEARLNDFPKPSDEMGIGRQWAGSGLYAKYCSEGELKENGAYLSTAFTARDLMQIVDAVTDDGLLKYWGKELHRETHDYVKG